jgi:hypothetical protein
MKIRKIKIQSIKKTTNNVTKSATSSEKRGGGEGGGGRSYKQSQKYNYKNAHWSWLRCLVEEIP